MESIKIFQNQKKNYEIEKKITESRKKKLNSKQIFRNREKNFRIEKNISESRKIFQNRENCFRIKKYFVRRIEKKSLELNISTTFIACVRLVTAKSCFAENVALKLEINIFSVLIRVPKVPFRVFGELKNEILNSILRFCFYFNKEDEIQITDYYFHV